MSVPKEECANRIALVRNKMEKSGIDGIIVTDPLNFYYFTGQKVPVWMRSRPVILVLPLESEPTVIDWSGPGMFARLYQKPYPNWVERRHIYPEIPVQHDTPVDWGVASLVQEAGLERKTIGIELGYETRLNLAIEDFELIKKQLPNVSWVDYGPVVWGCRMVKSEWEITNIRKACKIGGDAWSTILDELHTGISVLEIKKRMLGLYVELGADLDSTAQIVLGATGPNETFQKGDILYLDGGCQVNGYRMDFTRRAVFGPPTQRQLDEHNGMWEILFKLVDRMKPGVETRNIFEYSQSLLAKTEWTNYSDHPAKRIGHGIGLSSEPPYLNAFDKNVLETGMSLTPEPKIEVNEGLLNPEEHVIIGKAGAEIISTNPSWELRVVE